MTLAKQSTTPRLFARHRIFARHSKNMERTESYGFLYTLGFGANKNHTFLKNSLNFFAKLRQQS